jgi:uncharacterized membrane protein YidH (DUF202 family)
MNSPTALPKDHSATDYLAAERTFLAWIRTGLALMGFGFVVARFGLFLTELQIAQDGSALHLSGLLARKPLALERLHLRGLPLASLGGHVYLRMGQHGENSDYSSCFRERREPSRAQSRSDDPSR